MEKLCTGWEFGVLEFCFFLVVFFCQVWLQRLSNIFDLQSSGCLLPFSSCHLGSFPAMLFYACQLPHWLQFSITLVPHAGHSSRETESHGVTFSSTVSSRKWPIKPFLCWSFPVHGCEGKSRDEMLENEEAMNTFWEETNMVLHLRYHWSWSGLLTSPAGGQRQHTHVHPRQNKRKNSMVETLRGGD
jgi:hypothetical protein